MESPIVFAGEACQLEGLLWLPETGASDRAVVLCHPHPLHGGNMHNNVVTAVAEALQQHDIATLRFNFRGTGQSTGTHTGGSGEEMDVMAAVGVLSQHVPSARMAVAGYSFGAAVGMRAGATDARVERLVGVALPVQRFAAASWSSAGKPTLFVVGDNDTWCPLAALQALGQQMSPSPTVTVLAGADHFFWGRESDIAQAVVNFIGQDT